MKQEKKWLCNSIFLKNKINTTRVSLIPEKDFPKWEKETLTKMFKWSLTGPSAKSIYKNCELIPGEVSL